MIELDASTGAYADGVAASTIATGSASLRRLLRRRPVWVTGYGRQHVRPRLDASTGAYANGTLAASTIAVGTAPYSVSSDGTHVWVANNFDDTVTELDAYDSGYYANGTLAASTPIAVGSASLGVSPNGTTISVANGPDTVTELDAYDGAYANGTLTTTPSAWRRCLLDLLRRGPRLGLKPWLEDAVTDAPIANSHSESRPHHCPSPRSASPTPSSSRPPGTPAPSGTVCPPRGQEYFPAGSVCRGVVSSGHAEEGGYLHDHRQMSGVDSPSAQDP